jgi:hypothetical protein
MVFSASVTPAPAHVGNISFGYRLVAASPPGGRVLVIDEIAFAVDRYVSANGQSIAITTRDDQT